jgi:excinuclease UvrABC ATPase subunit
LRAGFQPVAANCCVTGVSGSGESTLVNDTLFTAVSRTLYRSHEEPAEHEAIGKCAPNPAYSARIILW